MYNELIELIAQFPTKDGKRYWIKALKVCDAIKGMLWIEFRL